MSLSLTRTEERQTETDDLSVNTQYEEDKQQHHTEFTLPCPYLSGHRHPCVSKPARVLSPVMEEEMKLKEDEAERKRNLVSMMTLEAKVKFVLIYCAFQLFKPTSEHHNNNNSFLLRVSKLSDSNHFYLKQFTVMSGKK